MAKRRGKGKRRMMQRLKTEKDRQKKQKQGKLISRITAVLFVGVGIALGNISEHYGEIKKAEARMMALAIKQKEEALAAAAVPEVEEESTETASIQEETESVPQPYAAAVDKLNLAYFYPDDAESDEVINSYAGQVFQELMVMDLDWLSDLYELSDISPSTMASRLGKSTKAIMGSYNPRDKAHKANNPSSWVIHDWKKIHVNFIDGDGKAIHGFSNVKDILSMASVYTYYTDMMDVDVFAEYSRQLWKNSHSYSLSMGDLYYCSGCLNKTEEELVREAEEDELAAERASSRKETENETEEGSSGFGYIGEKGVGGFVQGNTNPESESAQDSAAELADISPDVETETSMDMETGESADVKNSLAQTEEANVPPSASSVPSVEETKETGVSSADNELELTETLPTDSTDAKAKNADTEWSAAGVVGNTGAAGSQASQAFSGSGENQASGSGSVPAVASSSDSQDLQESGLDAQDADSDMENDSEKKGKKTQYDCPGHVDLYIRVKILGLEDKKGLFSIAKSAEKKEWEGWTQENIANVKQISDQDWFDDYGLSVSSFSLSTPLTNQEIDDYMNHLPADTSVTRRNIIHFALSSVGRVPYYWGGKASAPGYEGNNFGALIPADDKGRMLKGLDCSGWINWVYWSATGERLAGESTSSLCLCGKQISRSELKPGDIIVRTGTGAHVVMFLSWSADGRMNVIHESSASINNVSIVTMDAPWPYYRKLVE